MTFRQQLVLRLVEVGIPCATAIGITFWVMRPEPLDPTLRRPVYLADSLWRGDSLCLDHTFPPCSKDRTHHQQKIKLNTRKQLKRNR